MICSVNAAEPHSMYKRKGARQGGGHRGVHPPTSRGTAHLRRDPRSLVRWIRGPGAGDRFELWSPGAQSSQRLGARPTVVLNNLLEPRMATHVLCMLRHHSCYTICICVRAARWSCMRILCICATFSALSVCVLSVL